MKVSGPILWLGLSSPFFLAAGGIVQAITGEMGNLSLGLIWVGMMALLLFLYIHFAVIQKFLMSRSTRYGFNMAVMILVFTAILGFVSAMSVKYKVRVDLTANQRYSLSQQTIKILSSLDRDVEVIAFYRSDERTRQSMSDLLEEYARHSPRFTFWFVDPDRQPAEAAAHGITSYRTTLLKSGDRRETIGFESESKVTNALMKLTKDQVKVVYFVTGHGENEIQDTGEYGYEAARRGLDEENYPVRSLRLMDGEAIPADAAAVVVSGPRKDLMPQELKLLTDYLNKGGGVFFMLDPAPLPGLTDYLKEFGIKLQSNIIVDKLTRVMGANYLTPAVMDYDKEHPITRDLQNMYTFFPIARSVEVEKDPGLGRFQLARTSETSWARAKGSLENDQVEFDAAKDVRGPLSVMAVSTVRVDEAIGDGKSEEKMTRWGKVIVMGDSNFAGNTHIRLAGNKDLFLNAINWLSGDETQIAVREKSPELTPLALTDTKGRLVFWLAVVIAPSLILVLGIGVLARKRSPGMDGS